MYCVASKLYLLFSFIINNSICIFKFFIFLITAKDGIYIKSLITISERCYSIKERKHVHLKSVLFIPDVILP